MNPKTTLKRTLLCILTGIAMPMAGLILPVPALAGNTADKTLLDMRQAFQAGNETVLRQSLPLVEGHPLEPLAAYWALRVRLDRADAQEVRAFLQRYAGTYHEDRLRNDWLLWLGKTGNWTLFREELPLYRMKDDREVQCLTWVAEWQHLGGDAINAIDIAREVAPLWLAQKRLDEGCASAARQLYGVRALPPLVAWKRARWGMETGQLAMATQAVGMLNPDWLPLVNAIYDNPKRYLDEKVTALRARTRELVTLALVRLAASDPLAAAAEASKLRWKAQLSAEEKSWVWGAIGKRSAQRLLPEAMAHFEHADTAYLNDDHLAWKARAALRAGAWPEVLTAIQAMTDTQRKEAVWTYWLARALQAQGTPVAKEQASGLLERIARPGEFYEQLAQEALGRPLSAAPPPAPLTPLEIQTAQQNPGLQRALKAIDIGLRSEGVREWNYTVGLHTPGGMGERDLLAAADLACRNEVWDRCIYTSRRTVNEVDHTQRYPMPLRDTVVRRAREIKLDPAYVYGLIRQESRFVTDARSHVGASGLMQVMPATASWTARRIGLSGFRPEQLSERDTNITIGTAYLKLALDDFEGSMPMAAAAYNAGPGRPRNWRNGPQLEGAIWIENIPFDETRDYVKAVLANTNQYAAIITGQAQRLSARLGAIGPRTLAAQAPNTDLP